MINTITRFETISYHDSSLLQSPSTIKCLADVLKYIKSVLDDEATITLFELINDHLGTYGVSAHKLNISRISEVILQSLYDQFVNNHNYSGTQREFLVWLMSNPEIYEDAIPDIGADEFTRGLTLELVLMFIKTHHEDLADAHEDTLYLKLNELMSHSNIIPRMMISPESYELLRYTPMSIDDYDDLIDIINTRLADYPPSRRIVDYMTYPDTCETDSTGPGELASYLVEYGEADTTHVHRKSLDYYRDHSEFLVQDWMDPTDITNVTNVRANINLDYSKAIHLFPITNKHNSSFYIRGTIDKFTSKTLDLINIVGLRSSLACISLDPLPDYGSYDRILVSFNNYDADYTEILEDTIFNEPNIEYRIVIVFDKTKCSAHIVVGDIYRTISFNNSGMHLSDPHYLFISPRIDYREPGTIRIQDLRIYGYALTDDSAKSVISGFDQRS